MCLIASANTKQGVQCQIILAETVHLISLVAATGETFVRLSAHGVLMNSILTLSLGKTGEHLPPQDIRALLDECASPETLHMFGLGRSTLTGEYVSINHQTEKEYIMAQQGLVQFLNRVLEVVAGTKGKSFLLPYSRKVDLHISTRHIERLARKMDEFSVFQRIPVLPSTPVASFYNLRRVSYCECRWRFLLPDVRSVRHSVV